MPDRADVWYRDGVRFECTACGDCCRREGDVFLTPGEADAIAAHVHGPEATAAAFLNELWVEDLSGNLVIQVPRGGACPFLSADERCTVQPVKPRQCATYPFWPELFESRGAWALEARWCEGIGRGERFDVLQVARRLRDAES